MNNRIYVVAGNYQQFILYLKNKENQVYIGDKYLLYGLHKPKVQLVGTYYKRDDWYDIKILLQTIQAEIIYD